MVDKVQGYSNRHFEEEVLSNFPKAKADFDAYWDAEDSIFQAAHERANQLRSAASGDASNPKGDMLASGIVAIVGGVAFVMVATRLGTARYASREKRAIRKLPGKQLGLQSSDLIIEDLCLGSEAAYYSYTASVSTDARGYVSGGGTRTSSYPVFDFGWSVMNASRGTIRVQMTVDEVDNERYVVSSRPIWHDVARGERRRCWAGLRLTENKDFKRFILRECSVARELGLGGTIQADARVAPERSLYEMFHLGRSPLFTAIGVLLGGVLLSGGLLAIVLGACLVTCGSR